MVLCLHDAYRLQAGGADDDARRLTDDLLRHTGRLVNMLGVAVTAAPYLLRLGDLLLAQHREAEAGSSYEHALELALRLSDEVLTVSALRALAKVSEPEEAAGLKKRIDQITGRSLYLPLRRSAPLCTDEVAELRDLVALEKTLVEAVSRDGART